VDAALERLEQLEAVESRVQRWLAEQL
jgi:hypothetical protein